MSRFGRTEKIIFLIASIMLAIFSYFLYDDSLLFPKKDNAALNRIGTVFTSYNDVRRKNIDSFSWTPAYTKDTIFQNDSLFTGDSSEALIKLQDGTEIHLEPNSMITLNLKSGQMLLDLKYGNLTSEISKDSSLVVKSGVDEFKLEGTQPNNTEKSKIQFKKSHTENVGLKLLTGKVRLVEKKKAQPTELIKNSITTILPSKPVALISEKTLPTPSIANAEEIPTVAAAAPVPAPVPIPAPAPPPPPPPPPPITIPEQAVEKVRLSPLEPLKFDWQGSEKLQEYELEISKTENFNQIALNKKVRGNQLQITENLPAGDYFWRVKGFDELNTMVSMSPVQKLNLKILEGPAIIYPRADTDIRHEVEVIDNKPMSSVVEIRWQAPKQFKVFKYQLSRDAEFTKIIKEEVTEKLSVNSPRLNSGPYWVRIGAQTDNKVSSAWSKVIPFKLNLYAKKEPPADAPLLVKEKIKFIAPLQKDRSPTSETGPVIQWKAADRAVKYQLQISVDKNFTDTQNIETDKLESIWKDYKPGHYYFKVYAVNKKDKLSEPSSMGEIRILYSSPSVEAAKTVEVTGDIAPPKEAQLKWGEVPSAQEYIVEVDKDPQFPNPSKYNFKTNSGNVNLKEPGTYNYRVQALNTKGEALSVKSTSEKVSYLFKLSLKSPVPLEPYNNASIFLQKLEDPSIWIEWKKVTGADTYKIEVSDKPDFTRVLASATNDKNHFLINKKIPLGKIYWRVKAESKKADSASDWSKVQGFTIHFQKNEGF